jgi:prepilin-type N-terminal cleavage/methylation domain-containing protein
MSRQTSPRWRQAHPWRFPAIVQRRSAFTILEMLLSLSIVSVLAVACVAAMSLMARNAASRDNNPTTQASAARSVVDQITDDLNLALSIPEITPTALTLTLADRNGDGQPETLRYAWSGVPGDALTLQYNGGAPVYIADNVQALNFTSLTRTVGPAGNSGQVLESPEQLLASYEQASIKQYALTNKDWPAECFKPVLPANATSWKITRVKLQLKRTGSSGMFSVYLFNASGGLPDYPIVDSVSMAVTAVPGTVGWVEFAFSNAGNLDPSLDYCVAVASSSGGALITLAYDDKATSPPNWAWSTTGNACGSWNSGPSVMNLYVYGTITAPAP